MGRVRQRPSLAQQKQNQALCTSTPRTGSRVTDAQPGREPHGSADKRASQPARLEVSLHFSGISLEKQNIKCWFSLPR